MSKLTVVIMNWARPGNVRRLLRDYVAHPRVEQVIVLDQSRDHPLTDQCGWFDDDLTNRDQSDKVRYVRSRDDLGLPARFAMATMARTDSVLIVDDDIVLPPSTVTILHDEFLQNRAGAVGIFGRRPHADGTYDITTHHGPVPVLLTRAVITTPAVCGEAAVLAVHMARELGGEPFGNGEDIVLSHVAKRRADLRPNLAFNLPFKNIDAADANAISVRYPGHEAHRTKVVRWCRDWICK